VQVQRCLLDAPFTTSHKDNVHGMSVAVHRSRIPETQSFSKLSNLPIESCICLLGAIVAVVDIESLAACCDKVVPSEPFITRIIATRLLSFSDM